MAHIESMTHILENQYFSDFIFRQSSLEKRLVQALTSVTHKSSENALWGADNLWELHLGANLDLLLGKEILILSKPLRFLLKRFFL